MIDEAIKLADKCEAWPNVNLQPEENRLIVAALRSQPGTLAREGVARIKELYEKLASSPLGMSTAWERKASAGKPLLYGGKRGLLAYGTIATWDEFDLIVAIVNALPAILALSPSHEAGTQRNVAHEDCLNCHCSDESLCAGTEPRSRKMVQEIPFDPMDHHNALLCPYCNPQGLKFAESGTQDARVPKVRTNHHRNKEEAARLQALVTERYARDGAGTQEPVAWVVFAENGNIRLWGKDCAGPQAFADEKGLTCEPVYRAAPASQDATRKALTEDEVMKIITKNFGGKMWESLTRNAWKDGIEIAYPTYAVVHFVGDIIDALASPARADRAVTADKHEPDREKAQT